MNKLILVLVLVLFGCAAQSPTRTVFNCQRGYILGNSALFIGGSRVNDQIECGYVQVPIAPKSEPLEVHLELIDKNQK